VIFNRVRGALNVVAKQIFFRTLKTHPKALASVVCIGRELRPKKLIALMRGAWRDILPQPTVPRVAFGMALTRGRPVAVDEVF